MKKLAALLVLALAALTLVACGGDDSDSTSTTTEPAPESTSAGGSQGAGGSEGSGGASVVKIDAADSGLAYVQKDVKAKAGQVTIEFTNPQTLQHDVEVEDPSGEDVGKTELIADSKTTATTDDLKAGEYTFYCSVPGHREAGMEGTLTVE